ncbi:hypothetical protein ABH966_002611 [Lysinibacillus sp. RC46]
MLIMFLIVIPLLGVLWFVNFTTFLKNLKNDKSTHNQTVLGIALTFVFIFSLMYCYIGTH